MEFGFQTAHNCKNLVSAEMLEQKFAARHFGEGKLCAGMDGAQMIEVLRALGKFEQLAALRRCFDPEKSTKRNFCNALLDYRISFLDAPSIAGFKDPIRTARELQLSAN